MADTYICSMCHNEYEKNWSEEEALKEKNELFGDVPLEECDIVCDYCFNILKKNTFLTELIINPGCGPCRNAEEKYAIENIKQFIDDCEVENLQWERRPDLDKDGGRFAFIIKDDNLLFEIQMPGLPLEKVRFMNEPGQNLLDFPRLYRDGSSYWWYWAIITKRRYEDKLNRLPK